MSRGGENSLAGSDPALTGLGRLAAIGAAVSAAALAGAVLFGAGSGGYTVEARFVNAGQLVRGNPVQAGGAPIGSVKDIEITDDSQAEIELKIDDDHAPLRRGVRATIRQFSQSGIANRYIDLQMPPNGSAKIEDGGEIGVDETKTAVDLDQLFNTLDPKTRKALQGFFKGQARQFHDRGEQANAGLQYLNPALATSSRLFSELSKDTPLLERFLVDSSKLVTTVAERRDDLAALIGNLNETTAALGNQKAALAESIGRLPPFMRRANTTFVNLRAALDDVDPLVDASKPVARRLGPFLSQARALASDAKPTVRDLSRTIRRRGRGNDLIELIQAAPPLADIAVVTKRRTAAPGGRRVPVGSVRGAFPESAEAFRAAAPELAVARPYTNDFLGWFDDFSITGPTDALGSPVRAYVSLNELLEGPVKTEQYHRCPGGGEFQAPDRSNVLSEKDQQELHCKESDRAPGP
jgi:phospholipid/cholesterol/gamma-HCH transport system substrate-binding protein